jgi:hypothetical protein
MLDTGASSHLTGDRSALFDFQVLSKPIPLRVATDGCNDFITGTGTMIFPGKNGTTASVKGVMYCENARSTLISPAALRRAQMIIDYNSSTDTFLFKLPAGDTLIKSPIDSKKQSWTFPQPIRHNSHSLSFPSSSFNPTTTTALVSKPKLPSETHANLFPFPISKHEFDWHATDLNKDEMKLLFWHFLFGHAGLCRIRKMIKLKLGVGLPDDLPKVDIKCPVCTIAKGTRTNNLLSTYCPVELLNVIACNLMGPFKIPTFDDGKYVLTIRDLSSSYSEVKILKKKDETTKLLIKVINRFETATGKKVKCL